MERTEAQKLFHKHYSYAMKLKEGGKAWEREMQKCEHYKKIIMEESERQR